MAKLISPELVERARHYTHLGRSSSLYRTFMRFQHRRGTRLAAAMTYSAFLSLFPLLAVATALTAAVLGQAGVRTVNEHIRAQLPGIAGEFSLDAVAANAATVGVISSLILTWTGLSWVNTARGSMREIWCVDDMPGKFVWRKAADLASLVGLGLTVVVVLAASTLTSGLASHVLRWLHVADTTVARSLLWLIGTVLGIGAGTAMFAYVLAGIPRLHMPRSVLLSTALAASVLFDITKSLIGTYLSSVAGRSLYGAFGVPIALLVWFDITFVSTLFLSAWTATRTEDTLRARRAAHAAELADEPDAADEDDPAAPVDASDSVAVSDDADDAAEARLRAERAGTAESDRVKHV